MFSEQFSLEFSGLHYCLFVKVHIGFRLVLALSEQLLYLTKVASDCQELFGIFLKKVCIAFSSSGAQPRVTLHLVFRRIFLRKIQRRRRDLNPRAAINDLHPFQGCPFGQLGYFSKYCSIFISLFCSALAERIKYHTKGARFCQ